MNWWSQRALFLVIFMFPALGFGQNPNLGDTYNQLDAEVTQITTYFEDAYSVTERLDNGSLRTTLFSPEGARLVSLFHARGAKSIRIRSRLGGKRLDFVETVPLATVTTDWANAQAYNLWADWKGTASLKTPDDSVLSLRWREGFLRSPTAEKRSSESSGGVRDLDSRILAVETHFKGFTAFTVREVEPDPALKERAFYATFKTELFPTGSRERVGLMRWFGEGKILAWSFPGLTEGMVNEERLPGGWTFRPNMAWANIQSFAFLQSHRRMKENLFKNDIGCDGLHWLDNTVFRPCCDSHDLCYEKYGCTSRSWWQFWSSWSCTGCNLSAVFCFISNNGGGGGDYCAGTCTVSCCGATCIYCS